jgi:hypothetical protein
MFTTADVNIHALIAKYGIDIQIVRPEMTKFKMFREQVCHRSYIIAAIVLVTVIGKASCPPLFLLYVSCDGNLVWVPYWGSILQNRSNRFG